MIQSFAKVMFMIAMVAISFSSAGSVRADSPSEVVQAGGTATQDATVQQVGHEECTTGTCAPAGDCCDISCKKCGGRHGVCYTDNYCEKCRPLGLLGRIRYCGLFGRRCKCDTCRRGGYGDGYGYGNGHGDQLGGRFLPNGCGGKGCPPFGAYQMVYPLNPDHCDMRDGQVHAAQGYGVPMAVPLAPVVRHQYNYSWGVPASRITHISNHAPHRINAFPGAGYPGAYPPPGGMGMVPGGAYPPGYCPQCQAGQAHGH